MLNLADYITVDKDILAGQPVFKGTRVPVETLFDHVKMGISLEEFLEDFPAVSKDQALTILKMKDQLIL